VQASQQYAQGGGLQLVEAQVVPNLRVHVLLEAAVVAEPAAPLGDLRVSGEDGATVAHRREILRGVEGECGGAAEAADPSPLPLSALGLGAVLQNPEAQRRDELLDRGEIRRLTVQVHGD